MIDLKNRILDYMPDEELITIPPGDVWFFDKETYWNFNLILFKHQKTEKYVGFWQFDKNTINIEKLRWMLWRFCIVGFNSKNFDLPLIELALQGKSCIEIKDNANAIIKDGEKLYDFNKRHNIQNQKYNHIDLIEVAPLTGSLKLYGGRLHSKIIQDLPYNEDCELNIEQMQFTTVYCANDLDTTQGLFEKLAPEIQLRIEMSKEYQLDLRSKSDAQIAETVICNKLKNILGYYPKKPKVEYGIKLKYNCPDFISFKSKELNDALEQISNAEFLTDETGKPKWPVGLGKYIKAPDGVKKWALYVNLGKSIYKMGMGGLHSMESTVAHISDENTIISDNDVASFYPRIILNQGLYPPHLGKAFLEVYEEIVNTRIHAKGEASRCKKAGDREAAKRWKTIADSLKITINGSFGKLGNKYSRLYAPQLMLQVTITGQLVLLMLIELLESNGIEVVSGNTDGIVCKYSKNKHDDVRKLIKLWEEHTNFETEETRYKAIYSRDVNNYIAIKTSGEDEGAEYLDEKLGCKTKGTYCERGSTLNSTLSKNPEVQICRDAVLQYLKYKIPVDKTIKSCTDFRRFVTVKNVRGGGQKDGKYLGKVVRWYYAKNESGFISYFGSGHKVATSDNAKPVMILPDTFPNDINYDWYVNEAISLLYDCGGLQKAQTKFLF